MDYLGAFEPAATVHLKFCTVDSTGAPTALSSGAISVYKGNSTTQSTTGVTLTASFDSVTGLNHVAIDTSADGTFYATANDFQVVVTTGTVGGVSVVGYVVGSFSLRNRADLYPTTAGRTLDVSAGGEAGVDWANVGSPTTTLNLSGTSTLALEPTTAGRKLDVTAGGEAGIDWANIGSPTTTVALSGTTVGVVTSATLNTTQGAVTFASITSTGAFTVSDGIIVTCSTSNRTAISATGNGTGGGAAFLSGTGANALGMSIVSQSSGNAYGLQIAAAGTRAGVSVSSPGGTGMEIAGTTGVTVNGSGGTGVAITGTLTTSGTVTFNAFTPNFTAGSITAAVVADGTIDTATFAADTGLQSVRSNTAQAGGATSITLDASASSTTNFYKYMLIRTTGGTGSGQERFCTAYNGTTKVATVTPAWATNPDNTTTFAILRSGIGDVESILGTAVATTAVNGFFPSDVLRVAGVEDSAFGLSTAGQTYFDFDYFDVNAAYVLGTALTEGASGRLAGGMVKFFNVATPTGTVNSIPDAVAGASGGLVIAGSNAATTFTTLTASTLTVSAGTVALSTFATSGNFAIGGTLSANAAAIATTTTFTGAVLATSASNDIRGVQINSIAASPTGVRIAKNVALSNFEFPMFLSSDHVTPATGKTVTATRSLDGAAFASCANSVTEVSNGIYKINLATTDTNANTVTLRFTATSCDDTFVSIITEGT